MTTLPAGCEPRCPGCGFRELSAAEARARKEAFIKQNLLQWTSVLEPLREPAARWGYRRKALLHARPASGAHALGMVRWRGREEEFISIPACPVHAPTVNELFSFAARRVPLSWPFAYALVSGRALTLVLKTKREAAWVEEMRTWARELPAGAALFVNWNPGAGRRALDAKRTERVLGPDWLDDSGIFHGPVAFRQQIPELETAAIAAAREYLQGAGLSLCADLYCGLGASLAEWGRLGWSAAGVELSGESLAAAARNAPGALLLRGRTEERLPQVAEFVAGRPFVLYTNPPRDGQHGAVNEWILGNAPARVAYLSCNPRSLGRDLESLSRGYEVERLLPFDFFPQTPLVETLALLRRR